MDTGHIIKFNSIHKQAKVNGYMVSVVKEAIEVQDLPEGHTSVYVY
jgi:hypothetical protein